METEGSYKYEKVDQKGQIQESERHTWHQKGHIFKGKEPICGRKGICVNEKGTRGNEKGRNWILG